MSDERRRLPDTIVHLDDPSLVFEVDVQEGDDPYIRVIYTDESGQDRTVRFDRAQAGVVVWIIDTFDRRAISEFGGLLYSAVTSITELLGETTEMPEEEL